MKSRFAQFALFSVALCVFTFGRGGGPSGGGSSNQQPPPATNGQAQGVYSGTTSNGYSFSTIVLPNDKFYGIYGTPSQSGNGFLLDGMIAGQGTSGSSTYSASVNDFFYTGVINTGSVTASYVPGSSLNGTLTENGTNISFSGTSLPVSYFNYNVPASLSDISGTWTGDLLDGAATTVTINSNGSVNGSSSGCSFTGTVAADSSNKNFFDVSLTFGGSPCAFPNQTASGMGIEHLLSDGVTHQLLAAVTAGTSLGTVFVAQRSTPTPSITISPTSASVSVNGTTQFTATVSNLSSKLVNWQVNGVAGGSATVGTISTSGLYTAPTTVPNSATVTVTAVAQADSTKSASAAVTVTAPVTVTVSPATVTVTPNSTQQFTATVRNAANTAVTWQVNGTTSGSATVGSISTSGLYSAPSVPPSGSVTITAVSVADPSKSGSAIVTIGFSTASLNGQYAFTLIDSSASFCVVGSFTADGNGNLTGVLDVGDENLGYGFSGDVALTGYYHITSNGLGDIELVLPGSRQLLPDQYEFVILSSNYGKVISKDFLPVSGTFMKQDPSAFSNVALNGNYSFRYSGRGSANSQGNMAPYAVAGMFTADGQGHIATGEEDVKYSSAVGSNLAVSGSYSIGSNGHGTATLTSPLGTSNFSFYVVSASKILFISTAAFSALSGEAEQQIGSPFSNTSVSGAYTFWCSGYSGGNGFVRFFAGRFSADGHGAIAEGEEDAVDWEAVSTDISFTGNYSVSPNGRATVTLTSSTGTSSFVFYFVSGSRALFVESDQSGVLTGEADAQESGPFKLASVTGTYGFSLFGIRALAGELTTDGAGKIPLVTRSAYGTDTGYSGTQNGTGTYSSISSLGRGTATITTVAGTSQFVFYVTSPSEIILIGADPADAELGSGAM